MSALSKIAIAALGILAYKNRDKIGGVLGDLGDSLGVPGRIEQGWNAIAIAAIADDDSHPLAACPGRRGPVLAGPGGPSRAVRTGCKTPQGRDECDGNQAMNALHDSPRLTLASLRSARSLT